MSTIKHLIKGTGSYKIGEIALEQGDLLDIHILGQWTNPSPRVLVAGPIITQWNRCYFTQVLGAGKRYRMNYTVNSIDGPFGFALTSPGITIRTFTTPGNYIDEFTILDSTYKLSFFPSLADTNVNITINSIVEIPPLPTITTGTKYLACDTTPGTIAIPSKQAYGEWEFDLYKGADGNFNVIPFISNRTSPISSTMWANGAFNGYYLQLRDDEAIRLGSNTEGGNVSNIFQTATSYISNNTWYRLKVARLQSEGVFKDIPTLQTSDLVNGNYDTFTSNGRYGYNAISTVASGYKKAGTADEIVFTSGDKFLVEFDLKLNSGELPHMSMFLTPTASSSQSNIVTCVSGRNSHILTTTSTSTGVIQTTNYNELADYEVSGLTIRRIYDANSFAVFIKGGSFGNEWTLVDTTGGGGTNPVVDSTYTSSEFMVADLDGGDRLANIKLTNSIKQ